MAIIATNGTTTETRYLWCGEKLCQSRTATDTVSRRYYPEGEFSPPTGTGLYYSPDHLGSVRDVPNIQDGSVVASYDYDAYGQPIQGAGLYLANYRAYDPATGRWLSRDPIEENGGINLYTYVWNNPLRHIDPLGLMGNAPGRGPYPPDESPGTLPGQAVVGAVGDFLGNYQDMRDANTIGADKYFHCKANCEATRRGNSGEATACTISDTREWVDQNIKGDPASASEADQVANRYGRSGAESSPLPCDAVCSPFRPNGLPAQY